MEVLETAIKTTDTDDNNSLKLSQQEELEKLNVIVDELDNENLKLSRKLLVYQKKVLLCREIMELEDEEKLRKLINRYSMISGKKLEEYIEGVEKVRFVNKY